MGRDLLAILSGEERLEGEHLAPARAAVGHRRPPGWRWLPGLALGGGSTVVVLGVAGALVSDLRADLHAERTHRHALGAEEPTEQLALLRAAASLSGVEDVDADRFGNLLAVGAATRIIPGEAPVVTSAVTSDGRTLAVLDDAGQGRLLTLETGELLHAWQTGLQHPRNLQISRDGAVAAAQPHPTIGRSADGARVWTVADNRPRIFAEAARKVRLNAPGTVAFLLVGSVPGDLFVEAWDVRSGERRWQTPVPAATQGLQLSPDGDQIAVWTASETWNLDTSSGARGPEVRALPGRRSTLLWWPLADVQTWTDSGGFGVFVNGVERLSSEAHAGTFAQVSKDGTRLLVGGGSSRTVQLWDLAARQQVASWTHVGWVAPRFIDDDRLVVSTGPDRSVFVHEARHGQHMMTLTGNADSVTTMEAIEGGWSTGSRSGEVRVWALPSETVGLLTRTTLGFSPATTSYAKTGTVFGVKGGAVLSWSAEAGLVREVDVADALLVAPSPDGEWLVVAHENDVVSVTKRGAETAHISLSMPWSPTCAAVAPGHDRLLVGSTLGWQLVRMSTAEVIATGRMPAPDDGVNPRSVPTQCALTADGRIALLGGTTATLVLEGPSGFDLLPIDTDGSGVAELRLHATGALVAMGQYSGAVTTWTPEGGMQRLTGHDEAVVAIALSEAADRFATVSRDGVVQLWTEAGARLSRALSPRPLSSVGFHAGEEVLLTGSRDGHLQWWSVESGALLGTLDGDNTAIFQIVIDPVRGRVTTVDATHQITEWDSSRFQRAETSLASSGRWTNQRVCEGTQRVVPVVPFPDPETLWAPADLCGGRP